MKRISYTQYREGIASFVNFSEMLGQALQEALPDVGLKRVSAFSWRGYQITNYPGLKNGQYYCQVSHVHPEILVFEEYFEMVNNPFKIEFDLQAHGFFNSSGETQMKILTDFIKEAAREALRWNKSAQRREIVPERRW